MSADQTNHKKPSGKSHRNNRDIDKRPMGKPRIADNDPSSGQPGYDEEKPNRIDYSQQIGEFSNWSRRG